MSKAFVQKPAPAFTAKAVDKHGEFVDIQLSDYKGTVYILLTDGKHGSTSFPDFIIRLETDIVRYLGVYVSCFIGKYLVLFFYPLDL